MALIRRVATLSLIYPQLRQLPGTVNAANSSDIALARHFFDGAHAQQGPFVPDSATFLLSPQLSARQHGIHSNPPEMIHEAWKMEQQKTLSPGPGLDSWASEFGHAASSGQHQSVPVQVNGAWTALINLSILTNVPLAQRHLQISHAGIYGSPMGMYNMGWPSTYAASFNAIDHGKGKGREIDFEAAFEQVTASLASTQLNASRIEVVEEVAKEGQSDFDQ